jgi:hypothetical protein
LIWNLDDSRQSFHYLIHDNDTKFSGLFDNVFCSEGIKSFTPPFKPPKLILLMNAGYVQCEKNVLTIFLSSTIAIFDMFCKNMSITTTTIALTRELINKSRFQELYAVKMGLFDDTISWEVSFMITPGNHFLPLEVSDGIFTPYRKK